MADIISTEKAPKAVGPYSQAVVAGNCLFCSGQISINPETNELDLGDIKHETERVLRNLGAVIKEAGFGISDVVKVTVYLSDMNDFSEMNSVYAEFFGDHKPARATIAVKTIPKGAKVEIDAIAVKQSA